MIRIVSSLVLSLFAAHLIAAQGRVIDEETYNREMRAAGTYRLKENYRVRKTTRSTVSGPDELEVSEIEHPEKRRVTIFRRDRNADQPSSEWIFIGDKVYVKRQGTDWQVETSATPTSFSGPTSAADVSVEFRDLGIEPNGSMKVLQRIKRTRLTKSGESTENIQTVTSWIDRKGRLSKEEYKSANAKTGTTTIVMNYEVDPTIKVEAPIK